MLASDATGYEWSEEYWYDIIYEMIAEVTQFDHCSKKGAMAIWIPQGKRT
jgi:hypothetical protein